MASAGKCLHRQQHDALCRLQPVGTATDVQAAVIGAFSFTALTEQKGFHGDGEEVPWLAVVAWLLTLVVILLEMCALVKAMQLSILTDGLALKGPGGSMTRALEVMRVEYRRVHMLSVSGLLMLLFAAALYTLVAYGDQFARGMTIAMAMVVANFYLWWNFKRVRRALFNPRIAGVPHTGPVRQPAAPEATQAPSSDQTQTPPNASRLDRFFAGRGRLGLRCREKEMVRGRSGGKNGTGYQYGARRT